VYDSRLLDTRETDGHKSSHRIRERQKTASAAGVIQRQGIYREALCFKHHKIVKGQGEEGSPQNDQSVVVCKVVYSTVVSDMQSNTVASFPKEEQQTYSRNVVPFKGSLNSILFTTAYKWKIKITVRTGNQTIVFYI
jgi:hypothetical protein